MNQIIKTDGPNYPCCKRYYMFSLHSWKCQQANNWSINQDINFAPNVPQKQSQPNN